MFCLILSCFQTLTLILWTFQKQVDLYWKQVEIISLVWNKSDSQDSVTDKWLDKNSLDRFFRTIQSIFQTVSGLVFTWFNWNNTMGVLDLHTCYCTSLFLHTQASKQLEICPSSACCDDGFVWQSGGPCEAGKLYSRRQNTKGIIRAESVWNSGSQKLR